MTTAEHIDHLGALTIGIALGNVARMRRVVRSGSSYHTLYDRFPGDSLGLVGGGKGRGGGKPTAASLIRLSRRVVVWWECAFCCHTNYVSYFDAVNEKMMHIYSRFDMFAFKRIASRPDPTSFSQHWYGCAKLSI